MWEVDDDDVDDHNNNNNNKSCLFTFGKIYKEQLVNMHFGDVDITWVDTMKYLGTNFVSSKRVKIDICHFYVNSMLQLMLLWLIQNLSTRMLNCACLSHSLYRF